MFGSQALETAIGLALLFFVLASGASALAEAFSRMLGKRATDLEATLLGLLQNRPGATPSPDTADGAHDPLAVFKRTSVYTAARTAAWQGRELFSDRARPAYLSARSFADAVVELLSSAETQAEALGWPGLRKRVSAILAEGSDDVLHLKAGLENWFDESMARLQDAYKRWVTVVLFVIGLVVAVAGNVSTIAVAQQLWEQPITRQVAVDAATATVRQGGLPDGTGGTTAKDPAAAVDSVADVEQLGLPVGWHHAPDGVRGWLSHLAGWLITALMLMLGAPFWFDTLSRLVQLRTTGARPPTAAEDQSSAVSIRAARPSAPEADGGVPDPATELIRSIRAALA